MVSARVDLGGGGDDDEVHGWDDDDNDKEGETVVKKRLRDLQQLTLQGHITLSSRILTTRRWSLPTLKRLSLPSPLFFSLCPVHSRFGSHIASERYYSRFLAKHGEHVKCLDLDGDARVSVDVRRLVRP